MLHENVYPLNVAPSNSSTRTVCDFLLPECMNRIILKRRVLRFNHRLEQRPRLTKINKPTITQKLSKIHKNKKQNSEDSPFQNCLLKNHYAGFYRFDRSVFCVPPEASVYFLLAC